jgi:TRAP-type C4-dicarboxylate transport system permease small subunit
MRVFLAGVLKLNEFMQSVAAISLTFMLLLTTLDVVLRLFGKPIPGAVEIIAICGGIVIGFTVPISFWMRSHISVDFVLNWLSKPVRDVLNIVTRCVGIGLCLLISWNSVKIGMGMRKAAEVSGTLELPLYPV